MNAGTSILPFAVCFGVSIVVLACVLIAAHGGSDLAEDIAAISVGLAAAEAVWNVTLRLGRSLRPVIEEASWSAFRLELRVRNRIRLRGRTCVHFPQGCIKTTDVRRTAASFEHWGQDHPVPFHDCVAILPALRNLQELELGWQSWSALPSELSRFQGLRIVAVLIMPIREFPGAQSDFARWGYPRWWGILTGGLEIMSAVLIALPFSRIVGIRLGATILQLRFRLFCATAISYTLCHSASLSL